MSSAHETEESLRLNLDFSKLAQIAAAGEPVVPVAVQDFETHEVLLIAYVSREALALSLREKRAIFYSTSRREIWRKGETSGDVLELVEARVNCEQNSLLFLVKKAGKGSCHTKGPDGINRGSCYYRKINSTEVLDFVSSQE
ncbi:MAG: phosphoribosyl-AMP cyclohydrolase [Leptospiraceae bacterium]|nr:phosphoribosyl-AMP cyclohydrolase [Leptospiraceae bacterium]